MVGGGFVIPQVISPGTGPVGQMNWNNTAMGAVLPTASAMVTIPGGQTAAPFSIDIPIGQMTYGNHTATTAGGRYATPVLVQVPLFPFAPALFGVSTNIGQSFPGDVRTFMNATTTQTFGGPAHLEAGGRPGAATVTICAGNIVPDPIPATWTGSCSGFTPLTSMGFPGTALAPALARYTRTENQFGGALTQRQVERLGTMGSATWLGRINFNNFVAPYTAADMANTALVKVYPTLPQNLVEPVVWGANFGQIIQRAGAVPGNLVSALLTPAGRPQNAATVMVAPSGTGMGLVQTSTSWGGPVTTGMVTVQVIPPMGLPSTWTETGHDQRTAGGEGYISLVSGSISSRTISGPGTQRTMVTMLLPEPAMAAGLLVGIGALAAAARRRSA